MLSWSAACLEMARNPLTASGTRVPDAVSGFRAMSQHAALHLNIVSPFSYTIEMLIQAGSKHLEITSVPVRTNGVTRQSRLFRSIPHFISRSVATMVRTYAMYRPLSTFFYIGVLLALVGVVPIVRFLYYWSVGQGGGHVQSLVLGGVFVIIGFVALMIGLVADLINFNRQLIEITLEKVRRLEMHQQRMEAAESAVVPMPGGDAGGRSDDPRGGPRKLQVAKIVR